MVKLIQKEILGMQIHHILDYDNDSNGVLDNSGHIITGIPNSTSGEYITLGEHPDSTLRSQMGGDVPILVIDSVTNGTYDIVIPDINRNGNFQSDDEWMYKENKPQDWMKTEMV